MTDDDLSDTAELELMDTMDTDEMKQLPDPAAEPGRVDGHRPDSDAPVNEYPEDEPGFDPYNHS